MKKERLDQLIFLINILKFTIVLMIFSFVYNLFFYDFVETRSFFIGFFFIISLLIITINKKNSINK